MENVLLVSVFRVSAATLQVNKALNVSVLASQVLSMLGMVLVNLHLLRLQIWEARCSQHFQVLFP